MFLTSILKCIYNVTTDIFSQFKIKTGLGFQRFHIYKREKEVKFTSVKTIWNF